MFCLLNLLLSSWSLFRLDYNDDDDDNDEDEEVTSGICNKGF
jgi:hypothetical protein